MTDLAATRAALHGAAELLLAGPQHRTHGTIRLRVTPGGFATIREPELRIELDTLVVADRRIVLAGTTYGRAGASAGIEAGAPVGVYRTGSGAGPDDPVDVDASLAGHLAECFALGDRALRRFAGDQTPVLWPEHFDLGVTVDEVNYGVAPGDATIPEPYAYVGPWQPRTGEFWNVPFGAARPLREFDSDEGLVDFFARGRELAAG